MKVSVANHCLSDSLGPKAQGAQEKPLDGLPTLLEKPTRPLSAYNLYFRDERARLLSVLPPRSPSSIPQSRRKKNSKRHNKIDFAELAKVIAAKWKEIDASEKERYEDIAAEYREEYHEKAKAWREQRQALGLPFKQTKKKKKPREVLTKPSTGAHADNHSSYTSGLGIETAALPGSLKLAPFPLETCEMEPLVRRVISPSDVMGNTPFFSSGVPADKNLDTPDMWDRSLGRFIPVEAFEDLPSMHMPTSNDMNAANEPVDQSSSSWYPGAMTTPTQQPNQVHSFISGPYHPEDQASAAFSFNEQYSQLWFAQKNNAPSHPFNQTHSTISSLLHADGQASSFVLPEPTSLPCRSQGNGNSSISPGLSTSMDWTDPHDSFEGPMGPSTAQGGGNVCGLTSFDRLLDTYNF